MYDCDGVGGGVDGYRGSGDDDTQIEHRVLHVWCDVQPTGMAASE
jgi:hypothetical protein